MNDWLDVFWAAPALVWTAFFCLTLLAVSLTRLWLTGRQIRHVAWHRGAVPAAFAQRVDLPSHQKAADYTLAKLQWGMVEGAWGTAVLLGWTLLGGLDALNLGLRAWLGEGLVQQLALLTAFALVGGLLELPLGWHHTFRLESRFGFNKTSPALWWSDLLKSALLGAAIGLPLAALVLWLMQAAGPAWWLWAWAVWLGFNLLMMVIYPLWIAPLFNRFEPLQDDSLKTRATALMAKAGFQAQGFYVMDGSRRSAHANAYFTGFGAARRVVFYDTLLAQLTPAEIDAVLAHELGHFKHHHIPKRVGVMALVSLVGFALLGWLSNQAWFYTGLGVSPSLSGPNDALALILFMSVLPLWGFFVTPIMSGWSRRHEFQADAYASGLTNAADLASALVKLYKDNASTLTPDPLYARFHYSHPPAPERLARLGVAT